MSLAILVGIGYLCWHQSSPKLFGMTASLGFSEILAPQQAFAFDKRPFKAVQGEHFDIFRPWYNMRTELTGVQ